MHRGRTEAAMTLVRRTGGPGDPSHGLMGPATAGPFVFLTGPGIEYQAAVFLNTARVFLMTTCCS